MPVRGDVDADGYDDLHARCRWHAPPLTFHRRPSRVGEMDGPAFHLLPLDGIVEVLHYGIVEVLHW
jgi:hypothetical protein